MAAAAPPLSPQTRDILTPLIVACALFMEQMDGSIIATALPGIARSLQTDPLHLNLAITSYMFSLAVFIPLSGWMADRFGARKVFRAAIVVFVLGSVACGCAVDLWTLVLSRVLQGMGGAMMVPVGRLVLLRTIPKAQLVSAMGWVTAPALLGPVMGPPVGGLIVTYASWRLIFFINVPIGLLGFYLASKYIADIKGRAREALDLAGFVLMGLAMAGLVLGFETVGRGLLPGIAVAGITLTGALCLLGYLLHVRRVERPIIDLSLLRFPTYRASVIGGSLFRIGIGGLPFLLPMMLQYGFGLTPAASGFLTFASAAGAVLMKIVATPVIRTFGFRPILIGNALANALFLGGCALFTGGTPHSVIFIFLLVGGFFRSLQFTALNTIAYAEIPEPLLSRANTLYNMLQQLSLSMGIAVGALLLNISLHWHHTNQLETADFWPAYLGVTLIALLSVANFIPLSKQAGEEMSGHRNKPDEVERKDPA